ncbi:MAG TPA: helix-turn-helix transcriptional regulator [Humisphaera sp.]|nr:helix-turn-helix transcriptional regulator [Humisphaera sp.]
MNTIASISQRLSHRRLSLGMSCAIVARRSGLSLRTVQRVLSGHEPDVGLSTVLAIAGVLGMSFHISEEDPNDLRRRQADRQAEKVVELVQGTLALEAQALAAEQLDSLRQRTVRDLLAGSNRKLWAE